MLEENNNKKYRREDLQMVDGVSEGAGKATAKTELLKG
jgi:hypothetical protein